MRERKVNFDEEGSGEISHHKQSISLSLKKLIMRVAGWGE